MATLKTIKSAPHSRGTVDTVSINHALACVEELTVELDKAYTLFGVIRDEFAPDAQGDSTNWRVFHLASMGEDLVSEGTLTYTLRQALTEMRARAHGGAL